MKKNLFGILAVALAVGASAFTAPSSRLVNYDFVSATNSSDKLFNVSRATAVAHYGCDMGITVCAKAYQVGTTTEVISQRLNKN